MISRMLSALIRFIVGFLYQKILGPLLKFAAGPAAGCRFTVLLELFPPSRRTPRPLPRLVVWNLPDFPLSSMGRQWL